MATQDSSQDLVRAYQQLSQRYRQPNYEPGFQNTTEVNAYAAARMPATVAAILRCLQELPADFSPSTLVDLGAGTGAASLAALQYFSSLKSLTLVEQDSRALNYAKEQLQPLLAASQEITFEKANLHQYPFDKSADLVVLSYVLNELPSPEQQTILQKLIATNSRFILILMPGTPVCFQQLLSLRQVAIEAGLFIAAPCPHQQACPMAATPNDWCHFKVRLSRTPAHRVFKQAMLNFEDEKFCYLLISKDPPAAVESRIVKNPFHRSGHSLFDVCEQGELRRYIIGRKQKQLYKTAVKLSWGDIFLSLDSSHPTNAPPHKLK